jgi:predicted SprT family Zn-dependent metalloprotease
VASALRSLFAAWTKPALPRRPLADPELTATAALLALALNLNELAARVNVRWSKRLSSAAGLARPAQALILLNPRLREFPGEIDRTLRHELAHLVAAARHPRRRLAPHGPEWRRACADVGIPGEPRCHTLPLPRRTVQRPHVYQCPACHYILRRVRPINIRRRRLACRECCALHAGGKFDARFEFKRIASS